MNKSPNQKILGFNKMRTIKSAVFTLLAKNRSAKLYGFTLFQNFWRENQWNLKF
jgi:hypothetical protein